MAVGSWLSALGCSPRPLLVVASGGLAVQQHSRPAAQQSSSTAKHQSSRAATRQSIGTAEHQSSRASVQQSISTAEHQHSKATNCVCFSLLAVRCAQPAIVRWLRFFAVDGLPFAFRCSMFAVHLCHSPTARHTIVADCDDRLLSAGRQPSRAMLVRLAGCICRPKTDAEPGSGWSRG
jgi:hypothetical protein